MGDVGGTNARFAVQEAPGAPPTQVVTYPVVDYPNFDDCLEAYVAQLTCARPRQAAVGIANPIVGDHVKMTNFHWAFSIEAVRQRLGFDRLLLINDFTALALSLPVLPPEHLRRIGSGGAADPKGAIGLLGPGTGLGVSGLVHDTTGRVVPLGGEGGHVSLASANAREDAVIAVLRDSASGTAPPSARCQGRGWSRCTRRCARSTARPPPASIRPASPPPRWRAATRAAWRWSRSSSASWAAWRATWR